jgi:hypothetical protein
MTFVLRPKEGAQIGLDAVHGESFVRVFPALQSAIVRCRNEVVMATRSNHFAVNSAASSV